MPKRKRDFEVSGATQDNPQARRIEILVKETQNALHQAVKLAKGFERQKLSRRLRTASQAQNDQDKSRITAEIEAWKVRAQAQSLLVFAD